MELRGDDLYPTPRPLTRALLRVEDLPFALWEPAAGMGHMAAVLAEQHAVYASDLIDYGHRVEGSPSIHGGFDFLSSKVEAVGMGAIVTNPPFSLAADFVRKGLTQVHKVCILGRLAFLEGKGRADIIDGNLVRVYPFLRRPPMMHRWSKGEDGIWREWAGKKSDSAIAYAWFVFERDKVKPTELTRITWLDADL